MAYGSAENNSRIPGEQEYLLSDEKLLHKYTDWCPYATTMTGFSQTLNLDVVIQLKCKRWGCRHCGQRKMTSLAMKTRKAEPTRLITLTVANKLFENPRQAFDRTRRLIPVLTRKIRKEFGEFEYLRIMEVTKKGWPHYHHVVRSGYIPQKWLSGAWAEISGAKIVDVRKIESTKNVFWYVMKYLAKQKYIPWTTRRCSWSKKFFRKEEKLKGLNLDLIGMMRSDQHPYHYIKDNLLHCYFGRMTRDMIVFSGKKKDVAVREEIQPIRSSKPVRDEMEETEFGEYEGRWGKFFDM